MSTYCTRCHGLTASGKKCKRIVCGGDQYCFSHKSNKSPKKPKSPEKRIELEYLPDDTLNIILMNMGPDELSNACASSKRIAKLCGPIWERLTKKEFKVTKPIPNKSWRETFFSLRSREVEKFIDDIMDDAIDAGKSLRSGEEESWEIINSTDPLYDYISQMLLKPSYAYSDRWGDIEFIEKKENSIKKIYVIITASKFGFER